jgi:hypothetical protein
MAMTENGKISFFSPDIFVLLVVLRQMAKLLLSSHRFSPLYKIFNVA